MDHEGLEDVLAESLAMLSQIVIAEEQHPEFQRYFHLLCEKYKHLDGFLHDLLIEENLCDHPYQGADSSNN